MPSEHNSKHNTKCWLGNKPCGDKSHKEIVKVSLPRHQQHTRVPRKATANVNLCCFKEGAGDKLTPVIWKVAGPGHLSNTAFSQGCWPNLVLKVQTGERTNLTLEVYGGGGGLAY